jgi:hypothetical protein
MNYLELCQTVRQECGAEGNGPSSVSGQTGESLRFVNWVRRAWLKVQTSRNSWRWLHATTTKVLSAGVAEYAQSGIVVSRFGRWDRTNWVVYPTASGVTASTPLSEISYDEYEQTYVHRSVANGTPIHFAIGPDEKVYLGPAPDATGWTLRCRYYKGAQTLTNNTDEPECPADYHWIIVYEAMKYYARREAAAEIMEDAIRNYDQEEYRLERDQLERPQAHEETLA